MNKRTRAGDGKPEGADQTPEKIVEAESVEGERAHPRGADHSAEDAAVLAESAPPEGQAARETEPVEAAQKDGDQSLDEQNQGDQGAETAAADELRQDADAPGGDSAFDDEPPANPAAPNRFAAVGGLSGALLGLVGALIGGGIVLLGAEAMRPEALPVDRIATKAAVKEQLDAALARLSGEFSARFAESGGKLEKLGERLTLLDDREQRSAEKAETDITARAADIARLEDALATERTRVSRLNDELVARERERAAAVTAIREQVSALAAAVAATPIGEIGDAKPGEGGSNASNAAGAAAATRLALLEGGLRRLEARINGLSAEALPTPDLTRIDKLETSTRAAEKAREALEARLAGVERSARSAVSGGAAIGVAFAALSEAVSGAEPYKEPLALVAELAPPGARIEEALWASAEQGLPSYVALTDWLERDSWKALDASSKARLRSGEGGMLDRFSGLFTFRPDVEPGDASNSEAAVLDRARRRIHARDAAGALAEIDKLTPAAQQALSGWRAEAARRADAEKALETLRALLLGGSDKAAEAGR